MARHTKNLTGPISVRLRHQQYAELHAFIEALSEDEKAALKETDQSRLKYPEIFKNTGRPTNYVVLLLRLALDEYMQKKSDER